MGHRGASANDGFPDRGDWRHRAWGIGNWERWGDKVITES